MSWKIILFGVVAFGFLFGVIPTFNSVGTVQGAVRSPLLGQEITGTRKDVLAVPVDVTVGDGTFVSARIEYHGRTVWITPAVMGPSLTIEARILDPEVLSEYNRQGVVQFNVIAMAAKNQETMHIEFSGLTKESGTIPTESEPVPFRIVRKGDMTVSVQRIGSKARLNIKTNSRRAEILSGVTPGLFWTDNFTRTDVLSLSGGRVEFDLEMPIGYFLVVDGSGTVSRIDPPALKVTNNYSNNYIAKTNEANYKLFKSSGVVAYNFNGGELLGSVALLIIGWIVFGVLGWFWHYVTH